MNCPRCTSKMSRVLESNFYLPHYFCRSCKKMIGLKPGSLKIGAGEKKKIVKTSSQKRVYG